MPKRKLLLVGWDAADWEIIHPLLDKGLLPGLAQLVEKGMSGRLRTLHPSLSPMLWTSIATGRTPVAHGIHGFASSPEGDHQVSPVGAPNLTAAPLWDILENQDMSAHVINWFATHENRRSRGITVSDQFPILPDSQQSIDPESREPSPEGAIWPPSLRDTLDPLRMSPTELNSEGLIRFLIPDADKIDQSKDPRLSLLMSAMAQSYSIHAAATLAMESDPEWDLCAVYYPAIDEISHQFMPFRSPQMEGIDDESFELYKDVIDRAYQLHDLMLQRLIELAGKDAAICLVSDHGFKTDHHRPKQSKSGSEGMTAWHREHGIFAMSGLGIRKDQLVHGARVLDITPTLLNYFDLPISKEMEGRVLSEIFSQPRKSEEIDSWDFALSKCDTSRVLHHPTNGADPLIGHFARLGYLDPTMLVSAEAKATVTLENKWNLALSEFYLGRFESAMILLEECLFDRPERADFLEMLARCQIQLGLIEEAEELVDLALEQVGSQGMAYFLQGAIALEKGDYQTALLRLRTVRLSAPDDPALLELYAESQIRLRLWEDTEKSWRKVLQLNPKHAQAHARLARIALRRSDYQEAIEHARSATALDYGLIEAHFLLSYALTRVGEYQLALQPITTHLQLAPRHFTGWRIMASIREKLGLDDAHIALAHSRELKRQIKGFRKNRLKGLRAASIERQNKRRAHRESLRQSSSLSDDDSCDIVIVTGLPRSGTSLLLQILSAAGCPVQHDSTRPADEHNPKGYFEWSETLKLSSTPALIRECDGKAVKVTTPQLTSLEKGHSYRIIEVVRSLDEVVASQLVMLDEENKDPEDLHRRLSAHLEQAREHMRKIPNSQYLKIEHSDLINHPEIAISSIASFLGAELIPSPEGAKDIPSSELYRQRLVTAS